MESAPEPELTASPQVNDLIRTVHWFLETRVDRASLMDAVGATERFLLQMQSIWQGQLRYRERTPLFAEVSQRIPAHFTALGQGLALARGFREGQDIYQLMRGVDQVREAFNALACDLDALRLEEDAWPTYSRSPYMNLLMRMAHAVARGRLGADVLRDALKEMINHHRAFAANIDALPRSGREAAHYHERRGEIVNLLHDIEAGLLDAHLRVEAGRDARASLEAATRATERLFDILQEFADAEEAARNRPCFRCGTTNAVTNRHCCKCGAYLPPMMVEDASSAVDVRIGDQISAVGHVQTETTQKLANAVHDVQLRRIDRGAFRLVVEDVARRVAVGKRELDGMSMPNVSGPERDALEQTRTMMREGIGEMEEGLALIGLYMPEGNPVHLERGLETFLRGADKVHAVQLAASRAARGGEG